MNFRGSYVAMLTPFTEKNKVNEEKLREMVAFQIENGTTGMVPCGTTGESPTLTWEEHRRIIKIVVEATAGKAQVIAGTGSNNTQEAIEASQYAKEVGADAVLIVNPYYNKPTQEGLFLHFEAIAKSCGLPVVVYNIPGRSGVNVTVATLERLKKIENIQACKEASGDVNQMSEMILRCGDKISFLSGDDSLTLPLLAIGGKGIISVVANIVPKAVRELCETFFSGDQAGALGLHQKLFPLSQAMFIETNPIPVRAAMNLLGWGVGEPRLPITPLGNASEKLLIAQLKAYGLKVKN